MADTENKDTYGINRQAYPIPTDTFPGADTFDRFVFGHQIDHSLLSNSEIFEQHGRMSNKKLSSALPHSHFNKWLLATAVGAGGRRHKNLPNDAFCKLSRIPLCL